jgi:hypothetical protein
MPCGRLSRRPTSRTQPSRSPRSRYVPCWPGVRADRRLIPRAPVALAIRRTRARRPPRLGAGPARPAPGCSRHRPRPAGFRARLLSASRSRSMKRNTRPWRRAWLKAEASPIHGRTASRHFERPPKISVRC